MLLGPYIAIPVNHPIPPSDLPSLLVEYLRPAPLNPSTHTFVVLEPIPSPIPSLIPFLTADFLSRMQT